MNSTNYTLEKHLKLSAEQDNDYELLYSIWKLNKQNLMKGLNLVFNHFPHYSAHDISHSMTIVNNIQCILGEERIKKLGPTDTFLILMACLTHDIGMILTYNIIEEEWSKEDFKEVLNRLAGDNDVVLANAAKSLLNINQKQHNDNYRWALEIKNAVILITAELFRNKHAKQSADYILSNQEFKNLADNYYSKLLPNRFVELLAKIAMLHGEDFSIVMSSLYHQANGYRGDYIHPRFIACLLRLGDLLDFDNNRFNAFSIASIKEMPEVSVMHLQKHISVKHMLISPTKIEAELDCPSESVYRTAMNWFDWLDEEVLKQGREWTNITPSDLGGLPPMISKDSIKILYNGVKVSPSLLNLKFTMSQKKIFNILQGGGIYKEPGFAFIREIVQNAFDASKIQMWNDIQAGIYNSYLAKRNVTADTLAFPDEIEAEIYQQYPVNLTVSWLDDKKDTIHIECSDCGTGISEADLLRMTKSVGEIHKDDFGYNGNRERMPYWLKPTAAFGVGLQSIFFVSNTFEVETAYPNETSKRIIFRSAADNQYCSIVAENIKRRRGTTIKVDIQKEKFSELFGNSFAFRILDSVDLINNEDDDIYIAKLDDFVLKTFCNIKNLCFNYTTINEERNIVKEVLVNKIDYQFDGDYKYTYRNEGGVLVFDFLEKEFGSSFSLWFGGIIGEASISKKLLLRGVLVANTQFNFYKTYFLGFEWNLNSPKTDAVVDISRDNLTYKGKEWLEQTLLEKLLPKAIFMISSKFVDICNNEADNYKDINNQYLNYCLTAYTYRNDLFDYSILETIMLPTELVTMNKKNISAKQFFESNEFVIVSRFKRYKSAKEFLEVQEQINEQYNSWFTDKIIIWDDSYLYNSLTFNYTISEVLVYQKDICIYKIERANDDKTIYKPISAPNDYLNELDNFALHKCSRQLIYGLKKYSNISIKKSWIFGFERFPEYCTCCILSPFSDKQEQEDLLLKCKAISTDAELKEVISRKSSELIPKSLIKIVKQYNLNSAVNEEQIIDEYKELLYDYVKVKLG